jgi:hypothetical protein
MALSIDASYQQSRDFPHSRRQSTPLLALCTPVMDTLNQSTHGSAQLLVSCAAGEIAKCRCALKLT